MTGKVKSFCPKKGTGLIETEDGGAALFEIADVLTYDRIGLKPGKVVSFVAGASTPMHAYEIVVRTGFPEAPVAAKAKESEDLRFAGFHTEGGTRIYCFEERVAGLETRRFLVETEVKLLIEHHISLQEAPSLCLRLLQEKLLAHSIPPSPRLIRCLLSKADLCQFLAQREIVKPRFYMKPRRGQRSPAQVFGAAPPPRPDANVAAGPALPTPNPRPVFGVGGD